MRISTTAKYTNSCGCSLVLTDCAYSVSFSCCSWFVGSFVRSFVRPLLSLLLSMLVLLWLSFLSSSSLLLLLGVVLVAGGNGGAHG